MRKLRGQIFILDIVAYNVRVGNIYVYKVNKKDFLIRQ